MCEMGTRADFYVGRGKEATWIGSIAWDGYPEAIDHDVLWAGTKSEYLAAVCKFFSARDDVTLPADGWPWPWEDSNTTDCAYAFDKEKVWISWFGREWYLATEKQPEEDETQSYRRHYQEFPNMKEIMKVRLDKGSGLIVLGMKGEG
jgi:hypothetical protein